jgi:hypothetical protein
MVLLFSIAHPLIVVVPVRVALAVGVSIWTKGSTAGAAVVKTTEVAELLFVVSVATIVRVWLPEARAAAFRL